MSMARTTPAQKPRGFNSSTRLVARLASIAASFRSRSEETGAIVVTILVYRASPAATPAGYPSRCLSDTRFRRVKHPLRLQSSGDGGGLHSTEFQTPKRRRARRRQLAPRFGFVRGKSWLCQGDRKSTRLNS